MVLECVDCPETVRPESFEASEWSLFEGEWRCPGCWTKYAINEGIMNEGV